MFIRFVTDDRDARSHQQLGVIRASNRYYDLIDPDDWRSIESMCRWLNRNLRAPTRFSRSRKRWAQKKAICWFRQSARSHISAVCAIARVLAKFGIAAEKLMTDRPGYVVYEDAFQIAAIPFRDTSIESRRVYDHERAN